MEEIKLTEAQKTELAAIQMEAARVDLAARYLGIVPMKWIWKNVLKLSDKDIKDFGDFGECGDECDHDHDDEDDKPHWR